MTDIAGDGASLDSVFFVSMGDTVATTYISSGTLVLPAEKPTNCSAKTFVGWTTEANYNSDIAPTFANAGDATNANSVYYAVFADAQAYTDEIASVVFKDSADIKSWYDDEPDDYRGSKNIENLMVSHNNISAVHGSYLRPGAHGLRIGANSKDEYGSSGAGYARLVMGQEETIAKVVITSSKTFSNDYGLYIDLGDVHDSNIISEGENVVYTPAEPITANSIKLSTEKRAMYLKSVVIYGNKQVYNGYTTTTCQDAPVAHTITVNTPTNGTVKTDVKSAEAGETITITATPHHCYEVGTISVKDADNNDVTVSNGQFVMPDSDVNVTVNFNLTQYTITAEGNANGDAEVE